MHQHVTEQGLESHGTSRFALRQTGVVHSCMTAHKFDSLKHKPMVRHAGGAMDNGSATVVIKKFTWVHHNKTREELGCGSVLALSWQPS